MTVVIEDLHTVPTTPAATPSIRLRRALGVVAVVGALFATGVLAVAVFAGDDPAASTNPNQVLLDRGGIVAVERATPDDPHAGLNELGSIRAVEHAAEVAGG